MSRVPEIERLVEVAFVVVPLTTNRLVIVDVELFIKIPIGVVVGWRIVGLNSFQSRFTMPGPRVVVILVVPEPKTSPDRVIVWLAVRHPVQVKARVSPRFTVAAPPRGAAVVTVNDFRFRRFVLIVVVPITLPEASVARSLLSIPVKPKFVVVA
jgi:hypothetical protein